ncbi:MAG: trigger factor [bacterium]
MKWEVKDEKNCKKIITVTLEKEEVEKNYVKVFNNVKQNAAVDGFRKGKVPESIIKTSYKDTIKDEVIKESVSSTYNEVIKQLGLQTVAYPDIQEIKYEGEGNGMIYIIGAEVNPVFEVKDYKNIKIDKKKFEKVTDEDMTRELNRIRQYRGKLKETAGREVREGDFVTVNMQGSVDGQVQADMTSDKQVINPGSKRMLPEIEDGLKGMKLGQEKTIKLVFPKDYHNDKVAGKAAVFELKVNGIKEIDLPELNDDFVKTLGKYSTVEELKTAIKEDLAKQAEDEVKHTNITLLTKKLSDDNKFEVPDSLVDQELSNMFYRFENYLKQQGLDMKAAGFDSEAKVKDWLEKNKVQADENVRLIYVLRKIAEKENITIADADVEKEIRNIAEGMGQNPETLLAQAKGKGNWDSLKAKLLEDKVTDYLLGQVK